MSGKEPTLLPFFLPSEKGNIFSICFQPRTPSPGKHGILFFPPFAEEMNKSRRIVAEQARSFSALGYTVLVVDLFGTGDSEGEHGDADWATWASDIRCAMDWMRQQGIETLYFWGMRLGALLALDCARRFPDSVKGILLWQPVIKGAVFLTQFLRLRMAADLVADGEKITTKELKAQLAAGETIEVAGYGLSPGLAGAIEKLELGELLKTYSGDLLWLELLASEDRPAPVAATRLVGEMRDTPCNITFQTTVCESFWTLPELVPAPALIEHCTRDFKKTFQCTS